MAVNKYDRDNYEGKMVNKEVPLLPYVLAVRFLETNELEC